MKLYWGLLAVLVTGLAVLALPQLVNNPMLAEYRYLVPLAGAVFLVAVCYEMTRDDSGGHRPSIPFFTSLVQIIRSRLAQIRIDVSSARSHRRFGDGTGGHLAKDAGLLQVLTRISGQLRLMLARSATA